MVSIGALRVRCRLPIKAWHACALQMNPVVHRDGAVVGVVHLLPVTLHSPKQKNRNFGAPTSHEFSLSCPSVARVLRSPSHLKSMSLRVTSASFVRDLTEEGIEPNPGWFCTRCQCSHVGRRGHGCPQQRQSAAMAAPPRATARAVQTTTHQRTLGEAAGSSSTLGLPSRTHQATTNSSCAFDEAAGSSPPSVEQPRVERADYEWCVRNNLSQILSKCLSTWEMVGIEPLLLMVKMKSWRDQLHYIVSYTHEVAELVFFPRILAVGGAKLVDLMKRALLNFLPRNGLTCVVMVLPEDDSSFQTPFICVDFDWLLPELQEAPLLSLKGKALEDAALKALKDVSPEELHYRWLLAGQFFTDEFYGFEQKLFHMEWLHQTHHGDIVAMAKRANFHSGDIRILLNNSQQQGFVCRLSDGTPAGFILFDAQCYADSCVVDIKYMLMDSNCSPPGLGTAFTATMCEELGIRYPQCTIRYRVDVATTPQATYFWLIKKGFLQQEGFREGVHQPAAKIYPAIMAIEE